MHIDMDDFMSTAIKAAAEKELSSVKIPISGLHEFADKNHIYDENNLAEILQNNQFKGAHIIVGEPIHPGNFSDICGIVQNTSVSENQIVAEISLVGQYGPLIREMLDANGKFTFSLNYQGQEVEPGKYEIINPENAEFHIINPL